MVAVDQVLLFVLRHGRFCPKVDVASRRPTIIRVLRVDEHDHLGLGAEAAEPHDEVFVGERLA